MSGTVPHLSGPRTLFLWYFLERSVLLSIFSAAYSAYIQLFFIILDEVRLDLFTITTTTNTPILQNRYYILLGIFRKGAE